MFVCKEQKITAVEKGAGGWRCSNETSVKGRFASPLLSWSDSLNVVPDFETAL